MKRRNKSWKGYSLSEIRHRRMLNAVRCEVVHQQMLGNLRAIATNGGGEMMSNDLGIFSAFTPKGMLKRMLGALNYIDYGVLAFRLTRKIIEIVNAFKVADEERMGKE